MSYYLKYIIGTIKFATPIAEIMEIVRPKEIAKEQNLGKNFAGSFTLRDKKVLLYDLADFLKIKIDSKFEVIVAEIAEVYVGFKVSKVLGIVEAEDLLPFPEVVRPRDYFKGVIKEGDSFLQVLSLLKLISGPRLTAVKKYQ